jgi:copper chaperone CopZ
MLPKWTMATAAAALGLAGTALALAVDVTVSGIHNCCGQCSAGINKALKEAGATNVKATKTSVGFSADNADAAVKALFDAGFCGKVEGAKAPEQPAGEGKAKEVKIEGVHNCCGACAGGITKVLKAIGAKSDAKGKSTSFTVTGEGELDVAAVLKALRDAGFNARQAK